MRSVASTTLLTFRVDVPSDAFSVELRGSWDNFNHSYHLQQDPRRSSTNWVGIFTFKDIICNADSDSPAETREGCLTMGGTYWYHYLVNGVYEFCDDAQPSTTRCPVLPGEDLNILHVPCEEAADVLHDAFPDLSADTPAFTWNPQARYSTPRPNKFEALARKAQPRPPSPSYPSPVTPSCENPASFGLFPAQHVDRLSEASIRNSPDGRHLPPSRNPSARSYSRPWTSSDDNSMNSPRVRKKTSQLLRRARSLTTTARRIGQKQRKRNSPEVTSTPSSVPEPIQEHSTEDLPMAHRNVDDGRDISTSCGTVGCWAHQDCWQSTGSRPRRNDEEAARHERVASWMESHEPSDDVYDDCSDPWSRQERPDIEEQEHASDNDGSDERVMTGNHETENQLQRRPSRQTSRTQSPISTWQSLDWIHLAEESEEFRGFSGVVWQPQPDDNPERQHDHRGLYSARRWSHGRPDMYPSPSDVEDLAAYAFDGFLYDPWGGVGDYEVQDCNPGLYYAYSDDADQFDGYSSEQDSAHVGEPDHWPLQNMTANMASVPFTHTINTEGPNQSSEEGDAVVSLEEVFAAQARAGQESHSEQPPEAEDVQRESRSSDDGSWTSAASNHNGPLGRFRSIIERYRRSSSSPGSMHTEDGTRENNPSTPTQDSGFLGYILPEEESTSQVTLTKVSTQATVVRKNSFSNAPQLELNLDGGQLGDWSSATCLGELENFSF